MLIRELIKPTGGSEHVAHLEDAYAWCKRLALGHYENFPVGSILVPAHLRRHFFSVYAFSRFADDIGDEPWTDDPTERHTALDALDRALIDPVSWSGHPIMEALHATIKECHLPLAPFHRLIEAFRRDVQGIQPSTWEDVLEYCALSANPVGEIILLLDGGVTDTQLKASDAVCTALQVTNFLQDLSIDRSRGRHYLPDSLHEAVRRAELLFHDGMSVTDRVRSWRLRWELRITIAAGQTMLERCAAMLDDLPSRRPFLRKRDYFRVVIRALLFALRSSIGIR